ncbi:MAG: L,D-transpeptidase [Anaerovoracaceae bacterium]
MTTEKTSYPYTGKEICPAIKIMSNADGSQLAEGTDYTVVYADNISAGTATATVTGTGRYTGTLDVKFTISRLSISKASAKLSYTKATYSGNLKKPTAAVKLDGKTLKSGSDYTIVYKNNRNAGTATATIKGKNNYSGSVKKTFKIQRKSIVKFSAKLSYTFTGYDGSAKKPKVTVKGRFGGSMKTLLNKGTVGSSKVKISYKDNTNTGKATVTITGKGNYTGTIKRKFKIAGETEYGMYKKAQGISSKTKYLILVNTSAHRVGIYKGSKNNWSEIKYWKCANGAPATPTPKGTFEVVNRGTSFGKNKGYTAWYWTRFYKNFLFHSVLYQQGSATKLRDGRLGLAASHGCVRLAKDNSHWIYKNIPKKTKVISY